MKKNILTVTVIAAIGLIFANQVAKAQDTRFSQVYASPLLINPAIMGASPDMRFSLCYRNQWGSVNSGYSTYNLNGWYPFYLGDDKSKLDVGLSVMDDKAGAYGNLNADLAVDYNRQIAEDQFLCLALFGGYGQQSLTTSGLTYDDQYVLGSYSSNNISNENLVNKSKGFADVGFGFTWYMNPSRDKSKVNAFAGVSGYHLNTPNESMDGGDSRLPIKMSYIAGLKIFESNKVDISPDVMVTTQAGNVESAFGAYVDYNVIESMKLTLGLWCRRNDAIAILIGFEYKGFALGYSYDAITSTLTSYATGLNANEITLSYKLNRTKGPTTTPKFGTDNSAAGGSQPAAPAPNPSPFPQY
ncbi:MAG TPA: PorP/SprF family type IX secretion system membrane protein [Bacteroidia bacterium]|jgi:type IX secretion system PorP/SprF family membrane protein|nr:PorP/SprF family type IX secretion system membrane protein [Bacteroidia bacterium]